MAFSLFNRKKRNPADQMAGQRDALQGSNAAVAAAAQNGAAPTAEISPEYSTPNSPAITPAPLAQAPNWEQTVPLVTGWRENPEGETAAQNRAAQPSGTGTSAGVKPVTQPPIAQQKRERTAPVVAPPSLDTLRERRDEMEDDVLDQEVYEETMSKLRPILERNPMMSDEDIAKEIAEGDYSGVDGAEYARKNELWRDYISDVQEARRILDRKQRAQQMNQQSETAARGMNIPLSKAPVPRDDESNQAYVSRLTDFLTAPISPEEQAKRDRAANAVAGIGNLGNLLSAFSNLIYTTKGAANQPAAKAIDQGPEMRKEHEYWDKVRQQYLNAGLAKERLKQLGEYQKERLEYDKARLAETERHNSALHQRWEAMDTRLKENLDLKKKLAEHKISYEDAKIALDQRKADIAEAYNNNRITLAKYKELQKDYELELRAYEDGLKAAGKTVSKEKQTPLGSEKEVTTTAPTNVGEVPKRDRNSSGTAGGKMSISQYEEGGGKSRWEKNRRKK